MLFPDYRPRRMRASQSLRRMIRETVLTPADFVLPVFAVPGKKVRDPIKSLPGVYRFSAENVAKEALSAFKMGIPAVIVFGMPEKKDALGTGAYKKDGIVQRAIREIKNKVPEMAVITDVCLCQYTDHGHCGIIDKGVIHNDSTLELLARTAVSHAHAGADMVGPSDMMDGRVAEIRNELDEKGFCDTAIISYAVKYCSAYYGPFREAVHSAPQFGDRKTYQMDPANSLEAVREASMDVEEGADVIMVKPALAYLDIIARVREEIDLPVAAYNVSGEYAMIKAAEKAGLVDGGKVMMETLTSIKRAGADIILTYFAVDAVKTLNQ